MPTRRDPRERILNLTAPLLLVLLLAGVLALQAMSAERSHRATAERTLGDYADFAAFIIANTARQELERRLLYAFGPVRARVQTAGQTLPPPSLLARDRIEATRCAAARNPAPSYIRLDLARHEMSVEGQPLPEHATAWLADTLTAIAQEAGNRESLLGQLFADRQGAGLLAYMVLRDSAGHPLAAYAKTSCLLVNERSVFALALANTRVLPPTLTGTLPNDSLISVRVLDPHGHELYATPQQYRSRAHGQDDGPSWWGPMQLAVDIRPDVADRLVIGGLGYSRVPLALLLLLLILLFAGLAIAQLRKQQEIMRLREQFVSGVSHELRTPLQQILVFSQLLRMDKIEADERQHSLEIVERETRRLIHLVENVLRFSRASRGLDVLNVEQVTLEPLVRDALLTFELLARARNVTVRLEADPDVRAVADANAVRRVLLNLLDNAVKYGPDGQTVTVAIRAAQQHAIILVDDQGTGIPTSERGQVWEPFHRLDREPHTAVAGSGMGLSIVRDLVTRMNGTVRIEDAPGGGARFVVELPVPQRI
jgi:signal transduction histidine kinase